MKMYREVGTNPGLSPVVQVTEVEEAAVTSHATPSMMMEYLEMSLDILVPVKVTESPPTTDPCLGSIADKDEVNE